MREINIARSENDWLFQGRNRERLVLFILSVVCFFLHINGISKVYSPFLYGEEMGYWSNAAMIAGYDWSPVIVKSGIPWYSYGYSLILLPLFLIFDDMVLMYKAAIFLNAVFAVMSFGLCYGIAKRLEVRLSRYWLMLAAFCVSIYSSFLHQSTIAIVETFLYFIVWLVFWLFIRYEEKATVIRGVLLSCSVAYMYITHNRTVGIVIAYVLICIIMLVMKKIKKRDAFALAAPLLIFVLLNKEAVAYLSQLLWKTENISGGDYARYSNRLFDSFTSVEGFIGLVISIICKYWYVCAASFMLAIWGYIYGAEKLFQAFRSKRWTANVFSVSFYLLAYMAVFGIGCIAMKYEKITVGLPYRQDILIYGRYAECAVGVLLLIGILKLFDLMNTSLKYKIGMAVGTFTTFIVSTFVVKEYFRQIEERASEISRITTQVDSTPGIFYYHLIGDFSIDKCFYVAMAVSCLIYIIFCVFHKQNWVSILVKCLAIFLIVFCFVTSGRYSSEIYTYDHQNNNNTPDFQEIVNLVETHYSGAKIFLDSDNLYSYFTFQNRMIHNVIYAGNLNTIENIEDYDLIIQIENEFSEIPNEMFQVLMSNASFTLFNRAE